MPASVSTRTSALLLYEPTCSHCLSIAAQSADSRWVVIPVMRIEPSSMPSDRHNASLIRARAIP